MADLRARCDTCVGRDGCALVGLRPEYPACHRPIRRTRLSRLATLLRACAAHHRVDARRRDAVIAAVLEHHAHDRDQYSEVFELSAARSPTDGRERLFRFSYGFPGFRADARHAASFGRALASLYGAAALRVLERGLELAGDRVVDMPLVGLEEGPDGAFRFKLYLQLARGAGDDGVALAARWWGAASWARRFAGRALHMVAVDVGAEGPTGAKLYVEASPLSLHAPWLAGSRLAAELRAAGMVELHDALAIHAVGAAEGSSDEVPSRLDFGLAQNEVPWSAIRVLPRFRAARPKGLDALERLYRLAVRRLSVPAAGEGGLTAYYVLAEEDEPASAAAP